MCSGFINISHRFAAHLFPTQVQRYILLYNYIMHPPMPHMEQLWISHHVVSLYHYTISS